MTTRSPQLLANVMLAIIVAILAGAASLYVNMDGDDTAGPTASLHLTQAGWQETDAAGYTAPPPTLDSQALPNGWQPVSLPFAPTIALLQQAESGAAGGQAVRVSWLRIALDG